MEMPIIRLTVEHMRHEIVQAFGGYVENLKARVEKVVGEVVDRFDFNGEVAKLADNILREHVRDLLRGAFFHLRHDADLKGLLVRELARAFSSTVVQR